MRGNVRNVQRMVQDRTVWCVFPGYGRLKATREGVSVWKGGFLSEETWWVRVGDA